MCIKRKHGGCHVPKSHGRPEAPGCVRFGLVLRAYFSEVLRYVTMLSDGFVRQGQARCTDATSSRQFIGIFRVPASWESTGSHGQRRHACLATLGSWAQFVLSCLFFFSTACSTGFSCACCREQNCVPQRAFHAGSVESASPEQRRRTEVASSAHRTQDGGLVRVKSSQQIGRAHV